jgi:hypothetical protein
MGDDFERMVQEELAKLREVPGAGRTSRLICQLTLTPDLDGLDIEIDKAVAGHLIEHVIEKRQAAGEATFAASVEVYADRDLRFFGVTLYAGDAFVHCH